MDALFPEFEQEAPARYPDVPGARRRDTSKAAADAIAPRVGSLRERVLACVKLKPGTPERIANILGEPVMNIRPRLSELSKTGLVKDSGRRGKAMGGRKAIIWEAV